MHKNVTQKCVSKWIWKTIKNSHTISYEVYFLKIRRAIYKGIIVPSLFFQKGRLYQTLDGRNIIFRNKFHILPILKGNRLEIGKFSHISQKIVPKFYSFWPITPNGWRFPNCSYYRLQKTSKVPNPHPSQASNGKGIIWAGIFH